MTDKLYNLMDWPKIEEIVYSECSDPFPVLGPHKSGLSRLVQCFFPGSKKVIITWGTKGLDKSAEMELADENGFYAALIPGSERVSYRFNVFYEDKVLSLDDPYRFDPILTDRQVNKINNCAEHHLDRLLGAHRVEVNDVPGVYFAVFAPNSIRASVVADFNNFDGRVHQMRRVKGSALYEIFIPGEFDEFEYAFEIKEPGYKVFVKADPFAHYMTEDGKCICKKEDNYVFSDSDYLRSSNRNKMMRSCKLSLNDFADFYCKDENVDYEILAKNLIEYATDLGYTHIEIQDAFSTFSDSKDIAGYFSVNTRFGSENGFKHMVDLVHMAGIDLILSVNYAYFSKDSYLKYYEGCALFEHPDERIAVGFDGNHHFNFERFEVLEFLYSHLFYICEDLRCDGVKYENISRMLYLDYGKKEGEYVRNAFGGTLNLATADAIRSANALIKEYDEEFIIIADIDGDVPLLTDEYIEEGGYAFDYKESKGFYEDIKNLFKKTKNSVETDLYKSYGYAYAENFLLSVDAKLHRDICTSKSAKNYRFSVAYMYMYPGQKSLYFDRIMMSDENKQMVSDLNEIISNHAKIFANDNNADTFAWINFEDTEKNPLAFVRKSLDESEMLLCVANLSGKEMSSSVMVPKEGKYKEIFSSENIQYGGNGAKNIRLRNVQPKLKGNDDLSINIKLPAGSFSIFKVSVDSDDEEMS